MLQAERFAVTQQPQKVARRVTASHDHYVSDTRIYQRLNGVVNHRSIVNRQEVFVCDGSEWSQTRSQSTCKDNSFHSRSSLAIFRPKLLRNLQFCSLAKRCSPHS